MTELRSDAGRPVYTEVTCCASSGQPYMSAKSLRAFQIPESAIACAERTGNPIGSSTSVTAMAAATAQRPPPPPPPPAGGGGKRGGSPKQKPPAAQASGERGAGGGALPPAGKNSSAPARIGAAP